MEYALLTKPALEQQQKKLQQEFAAYQANHLKLDMSRGKPCTEQLDLTLDMFQVITTAEDCMENGLDCRNYGLLDGIPQAKAIFAEMLEIPAENIIVAGNSSLNLMYDAISRALLYGVVGSEKPWSKYDSVKFLCPVPGYDRHFAICESLGIEMMNVPMTPDGPNMDVVEALVAKDDTIKGIWCTPKYSNPDGITYSDETVRRFAALQTKAPDFRIFWDNAYAVHDLDENHSDQLLNLFTEAKKMGKENQIFLFASTSKISFPGSGVAIMASSTENLKQMKEIMTVQTIGYDKLNQLRHVKYFKNVEGIMTHMKKHAAIIRPKFEIVLHTLEKELGSLGIAEWNSPRGGYFISLNVMDHCATRVYTLAKEAGVTLTPVGATFPYHKDPCDRNLRIAPTFPTKEELQMAIDILCVCVKLASIEKLLQN